MATVADDASALTRAAFARYEAFAVGDFWPGFDPRQVPIALFDGERTWLRGFPGVPDGFTQHGSGSPLVYAGRHPDLIANSLTELDGVLTATVMIDTADPGMPSEIAALALHEAFHVFQRHAVPQWAADEAALFVYPTDSASHIADALIEEWLLAQALRAAVPLPWIASALRVRAGRHAAMPADAVEWERQTEMVEGIAYAVELQALQRLPAAGEAAVALGDIRRRCYRTGAMMALLLDRVTPDWRGRLPAASNVALPDLLAAAPAIRGVSHAAISPGERAHASDAARSAIADEDEARRERRTAFLARPGQQLEIVAQPGDPMCIHGFDPMNVAVTGPGELLHGRYLHLANSALTLEVLGGEVMTRAAGRHPLFDGVRTVRLAGLPKLGPDIATTEAIELNLPWLRLRIRDARIEVSSAGAQVQLR